MAKKRKTYPDDDGRVIAPMNVEGMPWYTPGHPEHSQTRDEQADEDNQKPDYYVEDKLTREEERAVFFGGMKAGILAALIAIGIVTVAGLFAWLVLGGGYSIIASLFR